MRPVSVVTSCSLAGWEKYGRRFVETFDKYWPPSVSLYVVSEDQLPFMFSARSTPRYQVCCSLGDSMAWQQFMEKYGAEAWVRGDSTCPRPSNVAPRWREDKGYNFRFDAYKFSKKVFAIEMIARRVREGRLLWIDADVLTFAEVPETLPERLLPSAYALSCLARPGYHSECGFVGYNIDHSGAIHFLKAFAGLYASGEVFNAPEYHDSFVFDWLRNKLLTATHHIPHRSKSHPFIASELGKYMDHLKGRRKDKGRSAVIEQVVHTKLPYWQKG